MGFFFCSKIVIINVIFCNFYSSILLSKFKMEKTRNRIEKHRRAFFHFTIILNNYFLIKKLELTFSLKLELITIKIDSMDKNLTSAHVETSYWIQKKNR